jgi:hypothetical protein
MPWATRFIIKTKKISRGLGQPKGLFYYYLFFFLFFFQLIGINQEAICNSKIKIREKSVMRLA